MDYRTVNGVKDIQVVLKEAGLYSGTIDGVWGPNTADGVLKLFQDYHLRANGGRTKPLPIFRDAKDFDAAIKGIKDIQSNLKLFKLYEGTVDGIFGKGTFAGVYKVFVSYRAYNKLPAYDLAWSKSVSPEFALKVKTGCAKRGWHEFAASWLMSCMNFETGGTYSPTIQNGAGAKYFGLIQFGDMAAADLGTTTAELVKLSQLEQLDWVFKYFDMWAKRGKTFTQLEDFYLTIFYPKAVGMSANTIIFRRDVEAEKKGYAQNNGFDYDKDGQITVGEINSRLYTVHYKGMDPVNRIAGSTLY
jgi:peptidoglycan hydrolase-like protein with peptidoglycan-binding domain